MSFAFVFPGQGSQSVGMMNGFDGLCIVRETFEEAG
ncbi:MAG: malonyl CoA-acyl carrier protein transacylase, partial [Sulfuricella sp.]|nr:malonyl CoA-acyl carrier protein transacylase [Sulfuricella sp.]